MEIEHVMPVFLNVLIGWIAVFLPPDLWNCDGCGRGSETLEGEVN